MPSFARDSDEPDNESPFGGASPEQVKNYLKDTTPHDLEIVSSEQVLLEMGYAVASEIKVNIRDFITDEMSKKSLADFEAAFSYASDESFLNGASDSYASGSPAGSASGDYEDLRDLQPDTIVPMTAEDLATVHKNIAEFCSGKPVTYGTLAELEQLVAKLKERMFADIPYDGEGACEIYVFAPQLG